MTDRLVSTIFSGTQIQNILVFITNEPQQSDLRQAMIRALSKEDRKELDTLVSLIRADITIANFIEQWKEEPRRT